MKIKNRVGVLFLLVISLAWLHNATASNLPENSITFILGEDKNTDNLFYTMAKRHFLSHPKHKTELVIDHFRTIEEVVFYLRTTPPPYGEHWAVINLVAHSSRLGLNIPIYRGHISATTKIWENLTDTRPDLPHGKSAFIHSDTLITLWGCSFGRKKSHLDALGQLFLGVNAPAIVRSPTQRVVFYENQFGLIERKFYDEMTFYTRNPIRNQDSLIRHAENYFDKNGDLPQLLQLKNPNELILDQSIFKIRFTINTRALKRYRSLKQLFRREEHVAKELRVLNIGIDDIRLSIIGKDGKNTVVLASTYESALLFPSALREEQIMMSANVSNSF